MKEITNVGVNISEKSTVIWNVADMLRGPFKPPEKRAQRYFGEMKQRYKTKAITQGGMRQKGRLLF